MAGRQPLHLPSAALDLYASGDAAARGAGGKEEAVGRGLSELRVRAVRRRRLQGADESASTRRRVRHRQASPLGKIDAGAVAQAIDDAKPDAIFSALFGSDLTIFVREGGARGTFKDRVVVDLLGGEPEYLDPLKDEAPAGWIVTGYPWSEINTPEQRLSFGLSEALQRLSAARFDRRLADDEIARGRHR